MSGRAGAADAGTVGADGAIEWRDEEDRLDREDGPARAFPDDGPAAIYPDGRRVWFDEGERIRAEGPCGGR